MLTGEMSYKYQPLRDPGSEIRVAILQPGSREDEISISFRTKQIGTEKTSVQLVRLSYPYLANLEADFGRTKISMKHYRTLGG
jgi:hypothetical protein